MKSMQRMVLSASLAIVTCAANAQTAVITERTLSFAAALDAAKASLESCQKGGYKVTVTVLGRNGRTLVVLHDDGANPHTIENSFRKAYTSLTFRRPSGEFGKQMASVPPPHGAMVLQNITSAEGALPIMAGKDLVGSMGISGAPGGHLDAACVQAGIDKIKGGLGG
jgi:uncharacterized protein GlcG (DUF336 family)